MKILHFNRNIIDSLPPFTETPGGGSDVTIIADSATNRNRLPIFIPDFARQGWSVEILPAIRICRLGKFISPKFAHRYVDAITLCALLRPSDANTSSPLFFDCALTIGEMHKLENSAEFLSASIPLIISAENSPLKSHISVGPKLSNPTSNDGERSERIAINLTPAELLIDQLIARASVYCTLKSGDILLPGSIGIAFPVSLNSSISASLNSNPLLSTRLK